MISNILDAGQIATDIGGIVSDVVNGGGESGSQDDYDDNDYKQADPVIVDIDERN